MGGEELAGEFAFDPPALDQLFAELAPADAGRAATAPPATRCDLARDLHRQGPARPRLGRAEPRRGRGARRSGATAVLLGDIFAKRGLYGEALERYRDGPGRRRPTIPTPPWARSARSSPSAGPATPRRWPTSWRAAVRGDVEVLVARARVRLAVGDALGALDCIREAQTLAPGRPDLFHLQAQVSARLGDRSAALAAFNAALQLDPSLVRVWFELGGIEEERGNWAAARAAYERALDLLPTYGAAALALADLLRRTESPARGDPRAGAAARGRSRTSWRR